MIYTTSEDTGETAQCSRSRSLRKEFLQRTQHGGGGNPRSSPTRRVLFEIDIELDPLRYCREDRLLPVSQADAVQLPFCDAAFDLVAALDTLEHLQDDAAALREFHRICRPDATLLVTVPAFPMLWGSVDDLGHHYRRYQRRELVAKVEAAGFSVRLVHFFNSILLPPIAAIRFLYRALPARPSADRELRSDFDVVKSGPLNSVLARILSLEARLLG